MIEGFGSYSVCRSLAFEEEEIRHAYECMGGEDFEDVGILIDFLLAMRDGEEARAKSLIAPMLERRLKEKEKEKEEEDVHVVDLVEMVRLHERGNDDTELDVLLVSSRICQRCDKREINSALLPCGHLCYCSDCVASEKTCLVCGEYFRAFCTFFLA